MKLVGRKITRNTIPGAEVSPTGIVNPVNGSIRFSKKVISDCGLEGKYVSVALAEAEGEKNYLYYAVDSQDGFKVSKGSMSARALARDIADACDIERTDKFSINVETTAETFPEYEGYSFFAFTLKEKLGAIATLDNTSEPEAEIQLTPDTKIEGEVTENVEEPQTDTGADAGYPFN